VPVGNVEDDARVCVADGGKCSCAMWRERVR
jgi:hypothetical protein